MLNRPTSENFDYVETKIHEIMELVHRLENDSSTNESHDYSLLDRRIESLLPTLTPMIEYAENELTEFNSRYPSILNTTVLDVLEDKSVNAFMLMKNKLEDERRRHAKPGSEVKEVTVQEVAYALKEMKKWNIEQIIQESCSFKYESGLGGGAKRDQLAIHIEGRATRILKSEEKDDLIRLRQLWKRRSDLQTFYTMFLKYKVRREEEKRNIQDSKAENKKIEDSKVEDRNKEKKKDKQPPVFLLLTLPQSFRLYREACSELYNHIDYVKSKVGSDDRLNEILNCNSNHKFILIKSDAKKDYKENKNIKKTSFCSDISRKSLFIEGEQYKGSSDDSMDTIITFVKNKLKSKLNKKVFDRTVNSINDQYVQDVIKFPCIVLDSYSPNKIHTAKKCKANLYVENNDVYIKVLHSDIVAVDASGAKSKENFSVEAVFKLGNDAFELVSIEKQEKKGLSTSKKLMLGIGAVLLIGGVSVLTAGIGGVALVAGGCALGVGAATTLGVGMSTSRFGNWYTNLTTPQKVALCCFAGAAFVALGVLTAGFFYAGLAGLTIAAALVAGVTTKAGLGVAGAIVAKTAVGAAGVAAGAKLTHTIAKSPSSTALISKKSNMPVTVSATPLPDLMYTASRSESQLDSSDDVVGLTPSSSMPVTVSATPLPGSERKSTNFRSESQLDSSDVVESTSPSRSDDELIASPSSPISLRRSSDST